MSSLAIISASKSIICCGGSYNF